MRCAQRNKRRVWYCLYDSKRDLLDENGKKTGEKIVTYGPAKEMWVNVSPATGQSSAEQFGNLENYDKVLVTCDLSCPIDENSVLFIDKLPAFTNVLTAEAIEPDTLLGSVTYNPFYVQVPVPDYTVRRIAKSLNSISIAVRKVTVM